MALILRPLAVFGLPFGYPLIAQKPFWKLVKKCPWFLVTLVSPISYPQMVALVLPIFPPLKKSSTFVNFKKPKSTSSSSGNQICPYISWILSEKAIFGQFKNHHMGIGLGNPLTEFTPHLFLSDFEAMGAKRGVHRDSPFCPLPKARRVRTWARVSWFYCVRFLWHRICYKYLI